MNHTNAKTCLSREIGGLPNACCWRTLPVACTSRPSGHRSSKVPGFQIDQPYIMQAKYFSHIGCNRRQDRNEIIIWINQTLFFQEKSWKNSILAGNTSDGDGSLGMNGTTVSNGTRPSPINISRRSFRNFLESFGKWKTPCISTFTRGSRNIFPWPLVKKGIR